VELNCNINFAKGIKTATPMRFRALLMKSAQYDCSSFGKSLSRSLQMAPLSLEINVMETLQMLHPQFGFLYLLTYSVLLY
jgi:hypothetical protein